MRAALRFVRELEAACAYIRTNRVCVELYGSLALTGMGHGTDRAVLLGLEGYAPDALDTGRIETILATIRDSGILDLDGLLSVRFREATDLTFRSEEHTSQIEGYAPDALDTGRIETILATIRDSGILDLDGLLSVRFREATDLTFNRGQMYPEPGGVLHPNGRRWIGRG